MVGPMMCTHEAGITMVMELMQMLPWDREQAFDKPRMRELCNDTFPELPADLRLDAGKCFATIVIRLLNYSISRGSNA